jgi:hypothetical protein
VIDFDFLLKCHDVMSLISMRFFHISLFLWFYFLSVGVEHLVDGIAGRRVSALFVALSLHSCTANESAQESEQR